MFPSFWFSKTKKSTLGYFDHRIYSAFSEDLNIKLSIWSIFTDITIKYWSREFFQDTVQLMNSGSSSVSYPNTYLNDCHRIASIGFASTRLLIWN